MRLPTKLGFLASTLLAGSMFTACASESAWTVRDRHGWPVQTWGHSTSTVSFRSTACDDVRAHEVDPDSAGTAAQERCGYYLLGYNAQKGDEEQARAYARLHYRQAARR